MFCVSLTFVNLASADDIAKRKDCNSLYLLVGGIFGIGLVNGCVDVQWQLAMIF